MSVPAWLSRAKVTVMGSSAKRSRSPGILKALSAPYNKIETLSFGFSRRGSFDAWPAEHSEVSDMTPGLDTSYLSFQESMMRDHRRLSEKH